MNCAAFRAVGLLTWLIVATLALSGCALDNPSYCIDDAVCADRRAVDPSVGPICHNIGHFCTQRCTGNDYCADETKPGYSPSTPICNAAGHCEGAGTDGGTKRPLGSPCSDASQCKDGFCEKGRCCDGACGGACRSCATGKCEVVPAGDPCADSAKVDQCSATEGMIVRFRCNASQICERSEERCSGYLCNSATTPASCLDGCQSEAQCAGTFLCDGNVCKGELPLGQSCGDNDALCTSRNCTDGRCCEAQSCGECSVCGSDGRCTPLAAGAAPAGQCAGDAECGAGKCDGKGACAYLAANTDCGNRACSSAGPPAVDQDACDGAGKCVSGAKKTPCTPYGCQAGACRTSCVTSAECVSGSACDRSLTHTLAGNVGQCVDPSDVLVLGGQTLAQGIAALAGRTVLRVSGGPFTESLSIASGTVRIIADSPITIAPSSGAAVQLTGGATLQLQGVTIDGGTAGLLCSGNSTLLLLDSTIRSSSGIGIDSNKCTTRLRRNSIVENRGGGVDIVDGQVVVSNNVIVGNGNFGISVVGGLRITRAGGALTLRNNTIAGNVSQNTIGSGVHCAGPVTLDSSIVWGNSTPEQSGCSFSYSIAPSGVGGTGNESADPLFENAASRDYRLKVGSPAIDRGDPAASTATVSTVDRSGAARIQGGRVDRGAHEKQ